MEQIQTQIQKKFAGKAFLGGMIVIGGLWVASSFFNPRGYTSLYNDATSYSGTANYIAADTGFSAPTLNSVTKSNTSVVGNSQERTVSKNYLSLHVKSVSVFHTEMAAYVRSIGGKVMSENTSLASDDQSESGTLVVLIPNEQADTFFALVGNKVIKVVDRQVTSYQITQEYTDIEKQLARYEQTYEKIQKYYDKAGTVSELLTLQSQLDQAQNMIDSLKGRKSALDQLSSNTQYTLYTSTNEYNLPYVPQGTFEFAKTFKLAVRSLVSFSDKAMQLGIYTFVYLPVILVLGGVYLGWKKYTTRNVGK